MLLTPHEAKRLAEAYRKGDAAGILGVLDRTAKMQSERRQKLLRQGEVDADYVRRMTAYLMALASYFANFQRQVRTLQRHYGISLKDLADWDKQTYETSGDATVPIELRRGR